MIPQMIFSILLSITVFLFAFHRDVGGMGLTSNLNALMMVLGGTVAATFIAYPKEKLAWTLDVLKRAFLSRNEVDRTIDTIADMAVTYRQGGIRALEQKGGRLSQGLLKTAIELMAFDCTRETIEQVLEKEAQFTYIQYETAYKVLYSMGRLAPAMGLAGTIITLIRVFGHIGDPKSLVGYMAVALLSTFYGVILANLCFVPLSNKLKEFMDDEEIRWELIREGALDLYDEEDPRILQYKLEALSSSVVKPDPGRMRHKLILMPSQKRPSPVTP